jgi:hypothetical protein
MRMSLTEAPGFIGSAIVPEHHLGHFVFVNSIASFDSRGWTAGDPVVRGSSES